MVENQPNQFKFQNTTATKKIFSLNKRIRAVAGGTSASKTISILIWCIDYCQSEKNKNKLVSYISESFPHLSGGAMLDFEMIMKDRGYWDDKRWVKSPTPTYTFETGNKTEFKSVDTYGKAHGPRRDVLFGNEINYIPYKIADQLITRTRETIWLDWNPTNEFWFDTEMKGQRDDIDFITLTYKDNEALDEGTIREIESHKGKKQWWKVYGLGQLGEVEGKIYKDWDIIDEVPRHARLERYGLDFGYSNDPACIVAIYYYQGGYIIDEILFGTFYKNSRLADTILAQETPGVLTVADSAEPKSIDEIRDAGVNIIGAKKSSEGSKKSYVNWSIDLVQDQQISMTKRSLNVIRAYRNYMWDTDKDGNITTEPSHDFSDAMDAVRYGIINLVKKPTVKQPKQTQPLPNYYSEIGV